MKKLLAIFLGFTLLTTIPACKAKDADVQKSVETALVSNPNYSGVLVEVKDGVASIRGEVKDEATRAALASTVSGVKGVKSVQNNTTVMAPLPPPVATAPVVVSMDEALTKGIADALKDHPKVTATVSDGVIVVSGEATPAERDRIKMSLDGLRPKKVDLKGLKIKR